MILQASGQDWKIAVPIVIAVGGGAMLWQLGVQGVGILLLSPFFVGPAYAWYFMSVRCPRCSDRWMWRQAATGKSASLQPALRWTACPGCGLTAAEMAASKR